MTGLRPAILPAIAAAAVALALAGCAGSMPSFGGLGGGSEPPAAPAPTPTVRPDDLVGRWGLASFQKPEDRARTEAQARSQCNQPYVITRGPSGGIMMHLYDNPRLQELSIKAAAGGLNYIGPSGEPAAGPNDREIVSFDGRIMVLRWMDPEVASRYGNLIYVRCGAKA